MTKKKIEDYFAEVISDTQVRPATSKYKNGVKIPFDSGFRVPNPVFNLDQQMALMEADRNAAALDKTPIAIPLDMYQQAVALDTAATPPKAIAVEGREPAATPVEYTAPINADQRVLAQLQALNGGLTPAIDPTVRVPDQIVNGTYPSVFAPKVDYPMGPTFEITKGAGQEEYPTKGAAGHIPQGETANGSLANFLKDSVGNPVLNNGKTIGLPNQSTGNVATGGKGGAGGK